MMLSTVRISTMRRYHHSMDCYTHCWDFWYDDSILEFELVAIKWCIPCLKSLGAESKQCNNYSLK